MESARDSHHDAWEPDWTRYVFSCLFECTNPKCKDVVACCGTGSVDFVEYEDREQGWVQDAIDRYVPKFFVPPLVLMELPDSYPDTVVNHLRESFALFFANPGAALNCNRSAVEAVLTDLGIKRFSLVNGRRRVISLHKRIQLLPSKFQEVKDVLLAVKWLGNAASHDGRNVEMADVMMAYDLLEHVLQDIYERKSQKIKAIAKKVNKKKGPFKK